MSEPAAPGKSKVKKTATNNLPDVAIFLFRYLLMKNIQKHLLSLRPHLKSLNEINGMYKKYCYSSVLVRAVRVISFRVDTDKRVREKEERVNMKSWSQHAN